MPDLLNWKLGILYILIINILSFVLFGWDKRCAQHGQWRVRERDLFLLAIAGGAIGGWLGMNIFRHKTRHLQFRIGFPLIILLQSGLVYYFVS